MSSTITSENLRTIFSFPFKGPAWKSKLTIGSLLYMLSILVLPTFLIGGYAYEIMRRIIVDKADPSLPEWDDLGEYLLNGLKLFGVSALYGSPALMFIMPYFFIVFLIPLFMNTSEEASRILAVALPITLVLMVIGSLLGFAFGMLGLAAKGHMVATGDFGAAFRIREWWPIFRHNIGGYFLAYFIMLGFSAVISTAVHLLAMTIILCFVVPVLMMVFYFYLRIVSNALFAKAYADGAEMLKDEETPLS